MKGISDNETLFSSSDEPFHQHDLLSDRIKDFMAAKSSYKSEKKFLVTERVLLATEYDSSKNFLVILLVDHFVWKHISQSGFDSAIEINQLCGVITKQEISSSEANWTFRS
jgi:hypothetical protein